MKRIVEDIKRVSFSKVYLLYGEEAYLRRQYCENLRKALVSEGDTMNYSVYAGKDIHVNEVIDCGDKMPLYAEHSVILIENSG